MTKQEVNDLLAQGYDCGQIALRSAAEQLGMDPEETMALAGGFGGGMFAGETCGAVIGALIAIGRKNGSWQPGDLEAKAKISEQFASFRARFAEKNGSCMCRELLGYNLSVPEEAQKIAELGLTQSKCPEIIWNAVELLKEYL